MSELSYNTVTSQLVCLENHLTDSSTKLYLKFALEIITNQPFSQNICQKFAHFEFWIVIIIKNPIKPCEEIQRFLLSRAIFNNIFSHKETVQFSLKCNITKPRHKLIKTSHSFPRASVFKLQGFLKFNDTWMN